MSNTIYFIRHGQNLANITHQFSYKKVDFSLTETGVAQAQATARVFAGQPIDEIYSSPLKRAVETAEIISASLNHLPVQIIEEFREINVGSFEGSPVTDEIWRLHDEILNDWVEGNHDRHFPDGENYFGLRDRMQQGLQLVLAGKENRRVIIVAHIAIIALTLKDIAGVPKDLIEMRKMRNCAITEVEFPSMNGRFIPGHLLRYADLSHLANVVDTTKVK
jgi:broad specificity phosphatase PhoE